MWLWSNRCAAALSYQVEKHAQKGGFSPTRTNITVICMDDQLVQKTSCVHAPYRAAAQEKETAESIGKPAQPGGTQNQQQVRNSGHEDPVGHHSL